MNDRFNIRYFNKNTKKFEYLKIGAVNFNLFTDWTVYEQGQFCTGLKDKNGKLIYEGDVVRFEETYECACFTNIKEVLFKIVWSDYSFKAKQIKIIQGNKSYEFPLTLSKLLEIEPYTEHQTTINLEVIGNIYENKELLGSEG